MQSVLVIILLTSCSSRHLISDEKYRNEVLSKYTERVKEFSDRRPDIFKTVNSITDTQEREAMQFIVAFMPLNDVADYDISFLNSSVGKALQSRLEMPWGKNIPEDIFLSFVLPQRVNNENLDSFRIKFYDEISRRVAGMSASEAALEINHWCHEKVAYQPSDSRTSAPMATILSARGRCGEESTFTVAALRTAGLPARQVYTPRWAHTDDNHAWVEVWIDGKWYYMGACEPEPVLDRGWFTEPARRAMMVHTKAFGNYSGNELVVKRHENYSELNNLPKYAVTKALNVVVTDDRGTKIQNATVDFLLYNYAELYPIASLTTDENGFCNLVTGLGDLVVWAHHNNDFGFSHVTVTEKDTITIGISEKHLTGIVDFDLKAPLSKTPLEEPDNKLIQANTIRIRQEDSIRQSYINSWMTPEEADKIAILTKLDNSEVRKIISKSMGNYRTISGVLVKSGENASLALRLLKNLSEKDIRDADGEVLIDHLENAPKQAGEMENDFYDKYILSPRIDNEKLSPWRSGLNELLSSELLAEFQKNPEKISKWIENDIVIRDDENYYNVPLTPAGVLRLGVSDTHSRKILFVAICRTLGIPSRLEPGTNRPQYFQSGEWVDVWFTGDIKPADKKAFVSFNTKEESPSPEYYIHFTLARFEEGRYKTLEFSENVKAGDMPKNIPLDPGKYMLLTGNRINDVTVLAEAYFFDLGPGENKNIEIKIRKEEKPPEIIGKVSYNSKLSLVSGKEISLDSISKKGIVEIWIEPGKEPTRHIFSDIPLLKEEFDRWNGWFVFFMDPASKSVSFNPSDIKGLPRNSLFAWDNNFEIFKSLFPEKKVTRLQLPILFYANKDGDILYFSEGYKIGIGDQILKRIN